MEIYVHSARELISVIYWKSIHSSLGKNPKKNAETKQNHNFYILRPRIDFCILLEINRSHLKGKNLIYRRSAREFISIPRWISISILKKNLKTQRALNYLRLLLHDILPNQLQPSSKDTDKRFILE